MDLEKVLKFILDHIDSGTIDLAFNEENFNPELNSYVLEPFGVDISAQMLKDVESNPDHYRRFIVDTHG